LRKQLLTALGGCNGWRRYVEALGGFIRCNCSKQQLQEVVVQLLPKDKRECILIAFVVFELL
jgi:hypothetical protein